MNSNLLSLVDTHAHLCSPEFGHDLGAVLTRARTAGVAAVIAVGETLTDAIRNLELSRQYPTGLSEINRPAAQIPIDNSRLHRVVT
jgi:Tat protein secretion system quality control protein TatD with DNase activity